MKKLMTVLMSSLCVLCLCLTLQAEASDTSYYVCFLEENYSIKSKNKMELQGDGLYTLENKTLTRANSFYVCSTAGERYYTAGNQEMKVDKTDSYAYTIYFSREYVFDAGHIREGQEETDCHITYALYRKEGYSLFVNDSAQAISLIFNPYQKRYDGFEASDVSLTAGDALRVCDTEGNELAVQTAEASGKFRIIYTPSKVSDGKEYGFDGEGNYGSGDTYIYRLYLEETEEYYIEYLNLEPVGEYEVYEDKRLYALERDLEYPDSFRYTGTDFFLGALDQKVEYIVWRMQSGELERIEDDGDEDVEVSKLKGGYAGWYHFTLERTLNVYTGALTQKYKQLSGFYLATKENAYLYDSYGLATEPQEYRLTELEEDDALYEKDYTQYRLLYTVTEDMLKADCYITDGREYYKNNTEYIRFTQAGVYEILFSEEHFYGRNQHYQFTLKPSAAETEEIAVGSTQDILELIENCRRDSLYSLGKRFYLTDSIDLSGISVQIPAFYGTLDGNYHHILNMEYTEENECENYGFIRFLGKQGLLQNIVFDNVSITAKKGKNVGIVGYSLGKIQSVAVNGKITGLENVGGIVGYHANYRQEEDDPIADSSKTYEYGRITGCKNTASVYGEKSVGGIAGFNGGKIYETENGGAVNMVPYSSKKTIENIGGIAGYSTGVIALCRNRGQVGYEGVADYVGGIAGLSTGMFYYTDNSGAVSGLSCVGGSIGCYGSLKDENDEVTEETDLNQHYAAYLINTADISGSNYVGGIIGRITSTGITLKNSISIGNAEAKNGSYAGGIAGQLLNGSIESVLAGGTIRADGTNGGRYVGGIAGYSAGEIRYAASSVNIIGNDYVGGIVGYQTENGILISTVSNTVLLPRKKESQNIGYVAGKIEGVPASGLKLENVKYNYFIGEAYGGIGGYTFQQDADDAARRMTMEEMICQDTVSENFMTEFAKNGFIGGKEEYSYPYLRAFEFYGEETGYAFDYDMEELFKEYSSVFTGYEDKYLRASVLVNFFEWNGDNGDMDDIHTYELIESRRYFYGEEISLAPDFVYAVNGRYKTDDGVYFVSWSAFGEEFANQNIYAVYQRAVSTLSCGEYLLEGEFCEGTEAAVRAVGNTVSISFTYEGKPIEVKDFIIKIKTSADYTVYITDGTQEVPVSAVRYGEYLGIAVSDSASCIVLTPVSPSAMPVWGIVLISCAGSVLVCVCVFLCLKKRKHKGNIF